MQATRTVTWKMKDGKKAEVEIVKTRAVRDNVSYSDGWNVNLGRETVERLELTLRVDGMVKARDTYRPSIITKESYGNGIYEKLIAAGAYARLGNAYIAEDKYNAIMAAIAEAEVEAAGDGEFAAVKEKEAAEEAKREQTAEAEYRAYHEDIKNGMCPKCHSWCYGDCSAR